MRYIDATCVCEEGQTGLPVGVVVGVGVVAVVASAPVVTLVHVSARDNLWTAQELDECWG